MAPGDGTSSASTPATPTTTCVTVTNPCNPGICSSQDKVDVEDWLNLYERVSQNNCWDPTIMLANVLFYLGGTPRVWFQTHEDEISSWDASRRSSATSLQIPPFCRKVGTVGWLLEKSLLLEFSLLLNRMSHTYKKCSLFAGKSMTKCFRLRKSATYSKGLRMTHSTSWSSTMCPPTSLSSTNGTLLSTIFMTNELKTSTFIWSSGPVIALYSASQAYAVQLELKEAIIWCCVQQAHASGKEGASTISTSARTSVLKINIFFANTCLFILPA
nr:uncharacterized protein LOC129384874 [Dermacentor andersoni]